MQGEAPQHVGSDGYVGVDEHDDIAVRKLETSVARVSGSSWSTGQPNNCIREGRCALRTAICTRVVDDDELPTLARETARRNRPENVCKLLRALMHGHDDRKKRSRMIHSRRELELGYFHSSDKNDQLRAAREVRSRRKRLSSASSAETLRQLATNL